MVVVRVVREPRSALGAQAQAVVLAHRLHRQCEHHRITQHGFEVEQAVLDEEPVLVFLGVVDRLEWVRSTGLDTALVFAAAFWVVAIAAGATWHRRFGSGPAEWLYRRLGG